MRKTKVFICLILVLTMLFPNAQYLYLASEDFSGVYAIEGDENDFPIIEPLSETTSDTVIESVYTDSEIVELDKEWLTPDLILGDNDYSAKVYDKITIYYNITENLNLVQEGEYGSQIEWDSSWSNVINVDGIVNRPSYLEVFEFLEFTTETVVVSLTATITKDDESTQKEFYIFVDTLEATQDELDVLSDYNAIEDYIVSSGQLSVNIQNDLYFPKEGTHGSTIEWSTSNEDIVTSEGIVNRPKYSYAYGDVDIIVTATFTKGQASTTKEFYFTIIALEPNSQELVEMTKEWLTEELVLDGSSAEDVREDIYLPKNRTIYAHEIYEVNITWESDKPDVIDTNGYITRPTNGEGNEQVKLTATIEYDGYTDSKTFTFIVTEKEVFPLALMFSEEFSKFKENYFQFNENAEIAAIDDTDYLQLYNDETSTYGSIFTKNKIHLNEDMSFSAAFSFEIVDHPNFKLGSNRLTFTLQPVDNTLYIEEIDPNLSFVFDTEYYSAPSGGQGTNYGYRQYVSVLHNGKEISDRKTYESNSWGTATNNYIGESFIWIEYNGQTKQLEVRASDEDVRPREPKLTVEDIDLKEIFNNSDDVFNDIYVGFTSSIELQSEKNQITSLMFKNEGTPIEIDYYDFIDLSQVVLSANPEGGSSESTVTASVYGADNTPLAGINVDFSTSLGEITPNMNTITDSSGKVSVVLSSYESGNAEVKAIVQGGAMAIIQVPLAVSEADSVALDKEWLTDEIILNNNSSLDNITMDLYLPILGKSGSTITWTDEPDNYITSDGKVTTPSVDEGDKSVKLTAHIAKGQAATTKTFDLTIKVLDEDKLEADVKWLTAEQILKGNKDLENITGDLNLPVKGPNGSIISWTSKDIDVITTDGTVIRPTYTEGDKEVELIATLRYGTLEDSKSFKLTVKRLDANDEEAVTLDNEWLTYERILNGNVDKVSIKTDLYLPTKGPLGSTISWSSDNEMFIKTDGTVIRPTYTQGSQVVYLTATITKGNETIIREFYCKLIALDQSDEEAVAEDLLWFDVSRTLGENYSERYIRYDLEFPTTALKGSTIEWASSDPDIISTNGKVNRPKYIDGNKEVTITATFKKGEIEKSIELEYYVVRLPDEEPPEVVSTTPENNALNVPWDTKEIVITFNEKIDFNYLGSNESLIEDVGIKLNGPNPPEGTKAIAYNTNNFYIRFQDYLTPGGEYELIIPEGTIKDFIENSIKEDITLNFTVEEKPTDDIYVVSSTPADKQKEVPVDSEISIYFNYDEIVKGDAFNDISIIQRDDSYVWNPYYVSRDIELDGNKITIEPENLKPGNTYELIIPKGVVKDRFNRENNAEKIQFLTAGDDDSRPKIVSIYPRDGQEAVNVNNPIIVEVSKPICGTVPVNDYDFDYWNNIGDIKLKDNMGNEVPISIEDIGSVFWSSFISSDTYSKRKLFMLQPLSPLKPATEYTVEIPSVSIRDFYRTHMAFDFTSSFTTGDNSLTIKNIYPELKEDLELDTVVGIEFSSTVSKGANFSDIEISDSEGNRVEISTEITDNKLLIKPNKDLEEFEVYSVHIPEGACTNDINETNDELQFYFETAEKHWIDESSANFTVSPSKNWMVNRPMTFDASRVESLFLNWIDQDFIDRDIVSWEWDFGDNTYSFEKTPTHTYREEGDYDVTLRIRDNKNFTYEFQDTITIGNSGDTVLKVKYPDSYGSRLKILDDSENYKVYEILLFYDGVRLSDEEIDVFLYQNGEKIEDLGTVKTDNGIAEFVFWYSNYNEGNYELVFVYGDENNGSRVARIPVVLEDYRSIQDLRLLVYDITDNELLDYPYGIYFLVDGKKVWAKPVYIDNKWYHVIEDLEVNREYNIQWDSSSNRLPYTTTYIEYDDLNLKVPLVSSILHGGYGKEQLFPVTPKDMILRVWSDVSDSNSNMDYFYFFTAGSPSRIRFYFDANWNGYSQGYFEIKTSKTGKTYQTRQPYFDFPMYTLETGERLSARMVTSYGKKSPWVDLKVQRASFPTLNSNVDIEYTGGEYNFSTPGTMGSLLGDKIEPLDEMPLFSHAKSFGIVGGSEILEGTLNKDEIYLSFNTGLSFDSEKKTKVPKSYIIGTEVDVGLYAATLLTYDENTDSWNVQTGELKLGAGMGLYLKKGYMVPKIDVGIEGTLKIGGEIAATLYLDKRPSSSNEVSGIIHFEPYASAGIEADVKLAKLEGYVRGSLPVEFHYPTGYISFEPTMEAVIIGHFLGYEKTLFSEELSEHWDNGEEEVTGFSMMSQLFDTTLDEEKAELKLIPRGYLNESKWLGGEDEKIVSSQKTTTNASSDFVFSQLSEEGTNITTETLNENVYPYSDINIVKNGDDLWLVWNDDNPDRDILNRTQIRYKVLKDGKWSEPKWFDDDGTADFTPVFTTTGADLTMAWQNVKKKMPYDANLGTVIKNSEITVANSVYGDFDKANIVTLTDDDMIDYSPVIASLDDNKTLLVWTKSEGLSFTLGSDMDKYKATDNSDSLYFSVWDGSSWSKPEEIQGSLPPVLYSSLTTNGEKGLLLYTLDNDNNLSTNNDREIYARVYDKDKGWGERIQITDNNVSDSNPKAVYNNGDWFIIWQQSGTIVYKESINGETKSDEFLTNISNDYKIAIKDGEKPLIALVYKQAGDDNVRTLSTAFYDLEQGMWSNEVSLTQEEEFVRSFSPVFTNDGKLKVAYTTTELMAEIIEGVEHQNPSRYVDLCMLTYTPKSDFALDAEEGLELSPEIPKPSALTTVTATVVNNGDFAENATITLYDGPPENGLKIAEVTTSDPIPARSSEQVDIEWIVGSQERDEYNIYAVVSSDNTDIDESNNMINKTIKTVDIEITSISCENLSRDNYFVEVEIKNIGSRKVENIQVNFYDKQSGQTKTTITIETLDSMETTVVSSLISSDGLTQDEDGNIIMSANAVLPEGIEENSTDNNTYDFMLEMAPIVVKEVNPLNGETQVGIEDSLTIAFNIRVEEGEDFDNITLEDDEFNLIDINKTIENNVLTITPINPMDYNRMYTLTIPAKAVGDSYGHIMEDDYNLTFSTILDSPEMIFAYPANNLTDVEIDTDITIQYSEEVVEGPTFEEINMVGPEGEKVAASASIDGVWLTISPAVTLQKNTQYTLEIPASAVMDDEDKVQLYNYTITFTTGEDDDIDDDHQDEDTNDEDYDKKETKDKLETYKLSRQILDDRSSEVVVELYEQSILGLKAEDKPSVVLDLLEEVEGDDELQIVLTPEVLRKLNANQLGLDIITGKADINLPPTVIESFVSTGEENIIITIDENIEKGKAKDIVSTGAFNIAITQGSKILTDFDSEITLSIHLDMSVVENAKRVIVCVYDEDTDTWNPMGGVTNKENETVTINTGHLSTYAAFERIKQFDDVTSSWGKEKVEILASRGLINGIGENIFAPDDNITRAEITAMIVRSLYRPLSTKQSSFVDVSDDAWFAQSVQTAYELGIINGVGDSKFDPNTGITREQLATIAYRFYSYKTGIENLDETNNSFIDKHEISSYAEKAVAFVANTGIMIGDNSRFRPKHNATRQEVAVVLYRLLEYMGEL